MPSALYQQLFPSPDAPDAWTTVQALTQQLTAWQHQQVAGGPAWWAVARVHDALLALRPWLGRSGDAPEVPRG